MAGRLKVRVDQDKCQGHARCKSLAPELFNLDEFGNAHEVGDGSVPAGLEDKAWLAQTNCPEIAIEVTEEGAAPDLIRSQNRASQNEPSKRNLRDVRFRQHDARASPGHR